jgi:type VI secretion system protein ImpL
MCPPTLSRLFRMTIPKNNLRTLAPNDSSREDPGGVAIWGLPAIAALLAALALVVVWAKGDLVGVPSVEERKTATIWIVCICATVVIAHLVALGIGAYAFTGRLFRHATGDAPNAPRPLKRDSRLQYLCDELRTSHGWFWRYRMPWLMVTGPDTLVDEVAPGLKQAGIMHVTDAILVHATPDGIDAAQWRQQIRQLAAGAPSTAWFRSSALVKESDPTQSGRARSQGSRPTSAGQRPSRSCTRCQRLASSPNGSMRSEP